MTRTARLVRIALVASCFAPAAAAGPPPASDRAPASAGPTASDRAPTWTWRTLTLLADGCRVRTPPRTDGAHDVLRLTFETTGGISKDGPFRVRSVGAALYRGFEDVEADQNALERVDPWSRNEHRARLQLIETGPSPGLDLEIDASPEVAIACQSDSPYATKSPGVAWLIWHGMSPSDPAHECQVQCLEAAALADP